MSCLELKDISYAYIKGKRVLKDINYKFNQGKVYTIVGKSGAGKSTLLSLVAGLDKCQDGTVLINDKSLNEINRDKYRSQDVGIIFQQYNLLTNATALENIVLSMNISKSKIKNKNKYALELLNKVGINEEKATRAVMKLSGGEQQRVAIARALAHNPNIIIADEPTGNLDKNTEKDILEIFSELAHSANKCVIIVTHSQKVTKIADNICLIKNGSLIDLGDEEND
ncbi:ABC transporter ATP-binding protein [Lysinibacillus sp. NPDC086135]|uniref:ABC transporter ATP-binding protein n=1 Tax=Lysinibacillus sp. NPDC086135 TaxID=3364130 RepID=UPI00382725B4